MSVASSGPDCRKKQDNHRRRPDKHHHRSGLDFGSLPDLGWFSKVRATPIAPQESPSVENRRVDTDLTPLSRFQAPFSRLRRGREEGEPSLGTVFRTALRSDPPQINLCQPDDSGVYRIVRPSRETTYTPIWPQSGQIGVYGISREVRFGTLCSLRASVLPFLDVFERIR